jgi:hypothetical protein
MNTYWVSMLSSTPSMPNFRPQPLCLKPPNGQLRMTGSCLPAAGAGIEKINALDAAVG